MKIFLKLAAVSLLASACTALQSAGKVENDYYSSNIERFMQNVTVKEETARFVTYEYKDVRIDEVSSLAARYCAEHGEKKAFLRENITYRNRLRRATFDCVNLQ